MNDKIKLLKSELGEHRIKQNVDLAEYTYSKTPGTIATLFLAVNTSELIKAVQLARELRVEFLLIGSGSKFTLPTENFNGLLIKNKSHNLRIFGIKGKVSKNGLGISEAFVEADSGVDLSKLSAYTKTQMLGGFEDLISSLGTIGGSILSDPIIREKTYQVKVLNSRDEVMTKELVSLNPEDIILSVVFKLKATG